MNKTIKVTIRPHMKPERINALLDTICNKLWPGAAGGAQYLTRNNIKKHVCGLVAEVMARNQEVTVRFIRKGISITMEPI